VFPARPYPYRVLAVFANIATSPDAANHLIRLQLHMPAENITIAQYPASIAGLDGSGQGTGIAANSAYDITWSTGPAPLWTWDPATNILGNMFHVPIPRDLWITPDVTLSLVSAFAADVLQACTLYIEP